MKLTHEGRENILWRIGKPGEPYPGSLGLSLEEFSKRLGYDSVPIWLCRDDDFNQRNIDRNLESLRNALQCGPQINVNANDFQTACLAIDAERARERMEHTTLLVKAESLDRLRDEAKHRRPIRKGAILNILAMFLIGFGAGAIWFGLTAPIKREISPARAAAIATPIVTMPPIMPTPLRSGEHARALLNPIMLTPEAIAPERIGE